MGALEHTSLARLELDAVIADADEDRHEEAGLLSRLKAQELDAFDQLVSVFERPVYSLCLRLLGDPEDARDAAQETFLKVYKGLESFRGDSGLKTWIYRIAINQAMNQQRWWRRRHREETVSLDITRGDFDVALGNLLPSQSASPEDLAIENERETRIMQALSQIKKEYRVALVLREIEEFSYEEIAETLSISIGTVKSRIARGREELRQRVKHLL
jgi:RNA polymerase sigma-70 factor (ECF subfamily)